MTDAATTIVAREDTWLAADSLPVTWPTFWTGHITAFTGIAEIDGRAYVFLGNPALPDSPPLPLPTMFQTALTTTATSSRSGCSRPASSSTSSSCHRSNPVTCAGSRCR